jgi:hypothetical protein
MNKINVGNYWINDDMKWLLSWFASYFLENKEKRKEFMKYYWYDEWLEAFLERLECMSFYNENEKNEYKRFYFDLLKEIWK